MSPRPDRAPLGIVGCGSLKADRPARARDLYLGGYFKLRLRCATAECERVLILSAKYGLVEPTAFLAPYDLRITDLSRADRDALGEQVRAALVDEPGPIRLYMGADYRRLLDGLSIEVPYTGGLGVQMGKMSRALRQPR